MPMAAGGVKAVESLDMSQSYIDIHFVKDSGCKWVLQLHLTPA